MLNTDEEDVLAERVTALLGLLEVMLCGIQRGPRTGELLTAQERPVLDRAIYAHLCRRRHIGGSGHP